jgi:periplasmic mercuric ion binding protein
MKSLSLTVLSLLSFATFTFSQQKTVDKVVIKTPEAQCEPCKQKIELYISREPGIKEVVVDIKKKTTTVTFFTDRNNIEQIKTAIANAGFDADDVTAEETIYKRLPPCCKKQLPVPTPKPSETPAPKPEN